MQHPERNVMPNANMKRFPASCIKKQDALLDVFVRDIICSQPKKVRKTGEYLAFSCKKHKQTHFIPQDAFARNYENLVNKTVTLLVKHTKDSSKLFILQVKERADNKRNDLFKKVFIRVNNADFPVVTHVIKKKKTVAAEVTAETKLYILPPSLISDEMLAEFYVCGRKAKFDTEQDALNNPDINNDIYTPYCCSYCKKYHVGRPGKNSINPTFSSLVNSGRDWYFKSPEKANRFLWQLMTQD